MPSEDVALASLDVGGGDDSGYDDDDDEDAKGETASDTELLGRKRH